MSCATEACVANQVTTLASLTRATHWAGDDAVPGKILDSGVVAVVQVAVPHSHKRAEKSGYRW